MLDLLEIERISLSLCQVSQILYYFSFARAIDPWHQTFQMLGLSSDSFFRRERSLDALDNVENLQGNGAFESMD